MAAGGEPNFDVLIPAGALQEFLTCPICLFDITDCYMTTCGHVACQACIRECLNRRPVCPLCNTPQSEAALVKNHHFDGVMQRVKAERERATKSHVDRLVQIAKQKPPEGGHQQQLSPIEEIYKRHTEKTLGAFESYHRELKADFARRAALVTARFAAQLEGVRAKLQLQGSAEELLRGEGIAPPDLARSKSASEAVAAGEALRGAYQRELGELEAQLQRRVALLVANFEAHLAGVAPSPFLLPVTLSVSVARSPVRFDAAFRATDTLEDVKAEVAERCKQAGDAVVSWPADLRFVVRRAGPENKDGESETLADARLSLHELRLVQGSALQLVGSIVFASQAPVRCFSREFVKGKEHVVDYFRCKDCAVNWVCAACAQHCHRGHQLALFMKQHKPSYGCCYCAKSPKCALAGK